MPLERRSHLQLWDDGGALRVAAYSDAPTVTFADGRYRLPQTFDALFDYEDRRIPRCQLRIAVIGGRPTCTHLAVEGDVGRPLTASRVRLPVDRLVNLAAGFVGGILLDPDQPAIETDGSVVVAVLDEREQFKRALAAEAPRPQRGRKTPDELLQRVAAIYRIALAEGKPPTQAVADTFPASRSTAGRWVVQARARGFLGKARRGVAGELNQQGHEHG